MTDRWYFHNMILRCEVGSTAHGTGFPGAEDHDEMAIVLEPPHYRLGLGVFETHVHRPGRAPTEKSQPGDLDLVIHSLHKYVRLALAGNPSILAVLWAPVIQAAPWGEALRGMASSFVCRKTVNPYLGYARAQRQRLERSVTGAKPGHMPDRPELVEAYGYDTKYAMHMVRLGLQGIELLTTGKVSFPSQDRELLYDIRRGKLPLKDIMQLAEINGSMLTHLGKNADLPPEPDYDKVDEWMTDVYVSWYEQLAYSTRPRGVFSYDHTVLWDGRHT